MVQVEATYCNSEGGGFRLQIISGQIYIVGEGPSIEDRHRNLKMMLLHLQGLHKLPDVDIGFVGTCEYLDPSVFLFPGSKEMHHDLFSLAVKLCRNM